MFSYCSSRRDIKKMNQLSLCTPPFCSFPLPFCNFSGNKHEPLEIATSIVSTQKRKTQLSLTIISVFSFVWSMNLTSFQYWRVVLTFPDFLAEPNRTAEHSIKGRGGLTLQHESSIFSTRSTTECAAEAWKSFNPLSAIAPRQFWNSESRSFSSNQNSREYRSLWNALNWTPIPTSKMGRS